MGEPDSANHSSSIEEGVCSKGANPTGGAVTQPSSMIQLKLDLGEQMNSGTFLSPLLSAADHPELKKIDLPEKSLVNLLSPSEVEEREDTLMVELNQLRSLVDKQAVRIHNLEQALDQSIISLEESRHQLVNQQFLEDHLASTEEIANIQQQAIAQLQHQLAQQQTALEAQQLQAEEKSQAFQELLNVIEQLVQGQQTRLVKLRGQIYRASVSSKQHTSEVLALDSSHELNESPTQKLSQYQAEILQLETELHRAHIALQEQQALIDSFQQLHTTRRDRGESLDTELFTAQAKIQDLETQISKQTTTHALLQHACQELEQARDRYQSRASELEQQMAEIQEQVLKQAQQASEYEATIQHWKDRYTKSQQHLTHLKELIEQTVSEPPKELLDLMAEICTTSESPESDNSTALVAYRQTVELPDFLARRQRYRVKP